MHGARKVEANALVVTPDAGRQLLLDAIHQYVPSDTLDQYTERLQAPREALRVEILWQLHDADTIDTYVELLHRLKGSGA